MPLGGLATDLATEHGGIDANKCDVARQVGRLNVDDLQRASDCAYYATNAGSAASVNYDNLFHDLTTPSDERSPLDKPAVDQYVRSNFFAGEHFRDLDDYRVVMARRLSQQRFQSDRSLLWIWMKRLLLAVAVSWRPKDGMEGVLERS